MLLVSIAGLTPGLYRGPSPAMPALAAMAREGVSADGVESVAPASVYPAHATLVTGGPPAVHGITADQMLGEHGVRRAAYWHASHLRAPTVWQLAEENGRRVAALGWPSTVGASIALLVPDVVPTRRGESWLGLLADSATPELLALARRSGGEAADGQGPARDAVLTTVACEIASSLAPPQLLLLRLSQTAGPLLRGGPDSPEAANAFRAADAELARLVRCLRDADRLARAAILVVGDHGTMHVHTRILPNSLLERAGLVELRSGRVSSWSALARSNGGSAFVYAQDESSAVLARQALVSEAARTRAFRVVSAQEMLRLGADPDAWFGLEAEPGFAFGNDPRPPLLRPDPLRAAGGYFPERSEMHVGFVAWGAGLRRGIRVPFMRQADVAPTLARLLGLDLGEVEGRVLVGALDLPSVASGAPRAR